MVKQKIIKEKQKSSYFESLLFDSANKFRNAVDPLSKANDAKKVVEKVAPQLLKSKQRFNLKKEPLLKVPIIPIDDAPGGMVPIGDSGWYTTPEEPASPDDCERYPDSPFCGGIPLSFKPIDIGLNLVIDECNLGIRLNPVIAFIKLPPIAVAYRKPECRIRPIPTRTEYSPVQYCFDVDCKKGKLYIKYEGTSYIRNRRYGVVPNPVFKETHAIDPEYPPIPGTSHVVFVQGTIEIQDYGKKPFCVNLFPHERGDYYIYISGQSNPEAVDFRGVIDQYFVFAHGHDLSDYVYRKMYAVYFNSSAEESYSFYRWDFVGKNFEENVFFDNFRITSIYCEIPPPPPPISPPEEEEMGCCELVAVLVQKVNSLSIKVNELTELVENIDDSSEAIENLVETTDELTEKTNESLEKLEKLSDIIGVDEYPASLPTSLISKDEGWLGNLIPNPNVSIPNLTRLLSWYIERFDEIMGQFEIPIEIKDADPTRPGNQTVGIKVDNIAEGIAESMGLLLQIAYNTEALVNINTRTLLETGGDKVQNFKTYMLLEALTEYMGFKFKEIEKKVALTFKPGESDLSKLLKEYEQPVIVADFDEKTDFQADLRKLMEAAAIIKARYFRKLDSNAAPEDIKNAILSILKQQQAVGKKVNDNEEDPSGNNSFDQFRNQVEEGFINEPGAVNTTNPYGRPYDERPKIRDID